VNGEMKAPLFSICHTSARPDKWRAVYDDWMSKAVHPENVEYILVIDPRWGFSVTDMSPYDTPLDNIRVEQNTGRRCYVDGVNIAARASTGDILIVNADDQFACDGWDDALLNVLPEGLGIVRAGLVIVDMYQPNWRDTEFVIECDEGGQEHQRGIMPMPILSRGRYLRQGGFVFYPEYESMCADNDFCESARKDGVVIEALHLLFPHRHPLYDSSLPSDAAYAAQNSQAAYLLGKAIYARRKACNFAAEAPKRSIVLIMPGELFQGRYLDAVLDLQAHLMLDLDFDVMRMRSYTSNPYLTREDVRRALANLTTKPQLCLWIDDDNPLSVEGFDRLLADLDLHSGVDGVAGWCWIHDNNKRGFMVSCGNWSADHLHWDPFPPSFSYQHDLAPFEAGGLPCFLMRYEALEKAQTGAEEMGRSGAFLPVLNNRLEHGMTGEDLAFFLNAEQGGCKFLVDPRVRVPHLKYVEVEPVLSSEGRASVKVACMMRVKNEARWIKRTIDSVRELCGENIFVMEDGSTDGTREIAQAAGAVILDSPFVGMGLDEARDKNWLLAQVIARCHPDWVLMPDGDEELEAGGCDRIRRALETNPDCDCFALGFLYFWDSVEQIRVDGNYGSLRRQSLFRANSDLRFKSYYSEGETPNQNHVGLHTSNAPGLGGKVMHLKVNLLHYGYLHREDRLQKYRWLLSIDPTNEGEDFYRHCVQGDIPEVPADAKLKHAGPLMLSKLPARRVPVFENGVPGPREQCESWATPGNAVLDGGLDSFITEVAPEMAASAD
jgi:hypothetical protein